MWREEQDRVSFTRPTTASPVGPPFSRVDIVTIHPDGYRPATGNLFLLYAPFPRRASFTHGCFSLLNCRRATCHRVLLSPSCPAAARVDIRPRHVAPPCRLVVETISRARVGHSKSGKRDSSSSSSSLSPPDNSRKTLLRRVHELQRPVKSIARGQVDQFVACFETKDFTGRSAQVRYRRGRDCEKRKHTSPLPPPARRLHRRRLFSIHSSRPLFHFYYTVSERGKTRKIYFGRSVARRLRRDNTARYTLIRKRRGKKYYYRNVYIIHTQTQSRAHKETNDNDVG